MSKLVWGILILILLIVSIVGSWVVGYRLGNQNVVNKINEGEKFLSQNSGAFCANVDCTNLGLKGTVSGYDYASRTIDFVSLEDKHFYVTLSEVVRIDDSYDVSYFEKEMKTGDVIWVVFDTLKSVGQKLEAIDVYIEKTGVLAKKRMVQ